VDFLVISVNFGFFSQKSGKNRSITRIQAVRIPQHHINSVTSSGYLIRNISGVIITEQDIVRSAASFLSLYIILPDLLRSLSKV